MQPLQYLKTLFVPCKENFYKPKVLRRSSLLFFLAITLASEGVLVSNLLARHSSDFLAAVVPSEVIALTNSERETNQAGDLSENKDLDAAAQAKADDMAAKGYFSHNGPDGKTPWQWIAEYGYSYQYAGENLAVRFVDSKDVVEAWMASPGHRANIVKSVYTNIGVGVAEGMFDGSPATFVVQYFGTPLANATLPASNVVSMEPAAGEQVAGASAEVSAAAGASSYTDSFTRQIMRALAEPKNVSNWVLGGVVALLILALFFAFFVHMQIQPTNMVTNGVVVAALALSFLALNLSVKEGGLSVRSQSATVSSPVGETHIGEAAAVGFALFPHE